jgi:hypothetical protein
MIELDRCPTPLDVPPRRDVWTSTNRDAYFRGASVAQLRMVGGQLHLALERAVKKVRLEGGSWSDVGAGLGITRQAAWERFRHLDDRRGLVEVRVVVDATGKRTATARSVELDEMLIGGPAGVVAAVGVLRELGRIGA